MSLSVIVLGLAMALDMLIAQGSTTTGASIRTLVMRGDSAVARALADSMARATTASPAEQADGLYWRGMLATSPRAQRLEFARVVVEFPLTSAAGDALYRIAQLDIAAGDRATARRQLQRALRDYGSSPTSGDAALELGQLLIANGEAREGCAALDSAAQWTAADQVEKRNRIAYLRRPCTTPASDTPQDTALAPSTGNGLGGTGGQGRGAPDAMPGARSVSTRAWSAQVGAFASRADADRVVARLIARGYQVRVTPGRPFRVRIGRFTSRSDATALIATLKRENTAAILVEAERP